LPQAAFASLTRRLPRSILRVIHADSASRQGVMAGMTEGIPTGSARARLAGAPAPSCQTPSFTRPAAQHNVCSTARAGNAGAVPELFADRAVAATRAFAETVGMPLTLRRAAMFGRISRTTPSRSNPAS